MKVTLAKALKLKNRFASKVSEVSNKITQYNSIIEGQERPVDINALMEKRGKLMDGLINLKSAINVANAPIQSTIYLLAELKGELNFLRSIMTDSGKQVQVGSWGDEDKIYKREAVLDHATVQGLIEQAETDIDANQDVLDKHNHSVEIDVEDEVIKLLRG